MSREGGDRLKAGAALGDVFLVAQHRGALLLGLLEGVPDDVAIVKRLVSDQLNEGEKSGF